MSNIKWIGVISDDLSQYQKGDLSSSAVKMKMPQTKDMMFKAFSFAIIPIMIIVLSMFIKTNIYKQVIINPFFVVIGFMIGFVCLLMHELLHAIVYPKEASVYIGIYPKAFAVVALASYPIKRVRFVIMSLLPISLGIIPIILFWIIPIDYIPINSLLFGMSIMGLVSPYPDFYNVYQVFRQTPKDCKIQFWEDDMYWIK